MEIKNYVGCKIVKAKYGTLAEYKYEKYGNDKDIKDTDCYIFGYIINYPQLDNTGMYISWSPKDIFETCYREILPNEINLITDNIKRDE